MYNLPGTCIVLIELIVCSRAFYHRTVPRYLYAATLWPLFTLLIACPRFEWRQHCLFQCQKADKYLR